MSSIENLVVNRLPGPLRHAAAGAVAVGVVGAKAPATPGAEEAGQAARKELSNRIYNDEPGLWHRIWHWILSHLNAQNLVPGVPSWVSTAIVVVALAVIVALLILFTTRISSTHRVKAGQLPVLTDDRDAAALTRAADEAAEQSDFATAVVERFRAIIRSLDERGVIDEYPGMTALEAATLTHQALDEHPVVAPLHEAAQLFDAVLYGHVVSTHSQDTWMRELAEQVADVRVPAGRQGALAGIVAAPVAGAPS